MRPTKSIAVTGSWNDTHNPGPPEVANETPLSANDRCGGPAVLTKE